MKFNDDKTPLFMIEDQSDTIRDISEIVERYYDMGTVAEVRKLDIGNTNFNYFITLKKDGVETKYFAQLFSTSKTLADLKYELALREYFQENSRSGLECAQACYTKDGG